MESAKFYDPTYYALNPFSAHSITWEWILYPTLEHAYHALRYPNQECKSMIMNARSPKEARDISQTLKAYQYQDWKKQKFDVMKELMIAKAQQHDEVQLALRLSWDMNIIKDIPEDSLWWIWPDGNWKNIMGKMWEEIRESYK